MSAIVIDTNVLLIADGQGHHMSDACRIECETRLSKIQNGEQTVLDDGWLILGEYQNKLSPNRSPTPGSAFIKWLLQRQGMAQHVSWVSITPTNLEKTRFAEFPADENLESGFDPADRKFVAASNAHADKPPILESSDSKWIGWEAGLACHGIRLEILCRCELEKIREQKTS